ncbi:MAG: hypothetical protein JWL61_2329 [Gemmatimonadetes bacterium]|nr:hypothetical protein [Gemmatimonadota bacterium]
MIRVRIACCTAFAILMATLVAACNEGTAPRTTGSSASAMHRHERSEIYRWNEQSSHDRSIQLFDLGLFHLLLRLQRHGFL